MTAEEPLADLGIQVFLVGNRLVFNKLRNELRKDMQKDTSPPNEAEKSPLIAILALFWHCPSLIFVPGGLPAVIRIIFLKESRKHYVSAAMHNQGL